MTDTRGYFTGHEPRECGEHRTVGTHRAWCFECSQWCYASDVTMGCAGCRLAALEGALRAVCEWAFTNHGGLKSPAEVWPGLAAVLEPFRELSE